MRNWRKLIRDLWTPNQFKSMVNAGGTVEQFCDLHQFSPTHTFPDSSKVAKVPDMHETIDRVFVDAVKYLGTLEVGRVAMMRRVYSRVCKDFSIRPDDTKRLESVALIILCATKDDEDEDKVFEIAHRWMRSVGALNVVQHAATHQPPVNSGTHKRPLSNRRGGVRFQV